MPRLDLAAYQKLTFFAPDYETFPCMTYCREAITRGGLYPAAVNAANEEAVWAFLRGETGFNGIHRTVETALDRVTVKYRPSLADILEADRLARETARAVLSR